MLIILLFPYGTSESKYGTGDISSASSKDDAGPSISCW